MDGAIPLSKSSVAEAFAQAADRRRALFIARDAMTAAILRERDREEPAPAPAPAPSHPRQAHVFALAKPALPTSWRGRWRAMLRKRKRRKALLASGLFDREWYLSHNPDVQAVGIDPLGHFLDHGSYEGRSPGGDFDTTAYLARYPDVFACKVEPWLHYVRHGKREGRATK